ncbi:MAG: N-acetylmuramoyl-L-alanine amidase [Polyangiaceae bacterium]
MSDTSNLAHWWIGRPRHRIPGCPRSASVVVLVLCATVTFFGAGCRRDPPSDGRSSTPIGSSSIAGDSETALTDLENRVRAALATATPLPRRAESATLAEELAVTAARLGSGARSLALAKSAADLRTRMWRVGHAEADARDAIDLYTQVARDALVQGELDEGCAASQGRAFLAAELAKDPDRLYRELYVAARLFAKSRCANECERRLASLAPHAPAKTVIATLDEQVAKDRQAAFARRAETALPAPIVSSDGAGVVLTPPRTRGAPRVKVVSIDPYGSKDRARVVIALSGPTSYRAGDLGNNRLFLDLEHTEPSARREIAVSGLVDKVRQGKREGHAPDTGTTRVELDLSAAAHRRIFYLPEPFRVVIDLATHEAPRVTAPPGSPRQVKRVAIDAGHGGSDPGAIGPTGLKEKDVTLAIAHLVAPMLSNELGILTMLIRDDDRFVPLDERAARANAFHADLFISIHCNASENAAAHGVMSFVLDSARDEIASAIAARENATSVAAASQAATIASGLKLADLGARSTHFAELLQHASVTTLAGNFSDISDQGVKRAGFFVLLGAEMPSVLFETSFISNPWEERRLATPEYRLRLASSLAAAVRAYREGL